MNSTLTPIPELAASHELMTSATQRLQVRIQSGRWQIEGAIHVSLRGKESRALTNLLQQAPGFIPLTQAELQDLQGQLPTRKVAFIEINTQKIDWIEPLDNK